MKAFNIKPVREIPAPYCDILTTIRQVEAERRVQFPQDLSGYRLSNEIILAPSYFCESMLVHKIVLQFLEGNRLFSTYTSPVKPNLGEITLRHKKIHKDSFLFRVSRGTVTLMSANSFTEEKDWTLEVAQENQFAPVFDRLTNLVGFSIGLYCGQLLCVPTQMFR